MSSEKTPLYSVIYNDIANKIKKGELKAGDKLPTEHELMETYQVSRITVNRAMNDLAAKNMIVRKRKTGSYVQNIHSDAEKPKAVIACVVSVDSHYLGNLIDGMQYAAQKHNFIINTYCSNRNPDNEHKILEKLIDDNIDGLICQSTESYENIGLFLQLKLRNIPIVAIDHPISCISVPVISSNHCKAGYDVTKYLIDKGHKRIAFATYSLASNYGEQERIRGYMEAMKEYRIDFNPNYIAVLDSNTVHNMMAEEDATREDLACSMLTKLVALDEPPTALICVHDMLAALLLNQALQVGISVPKQLSIVGFDNMYYCDLLQVPLSSVAQDFFSIGNSAVEQIWNLKEKNDVEPFTYLPCAIIDRKSIETI